MDLTIPLRCHYLESHSLYLTVTYFGPKSKCGICRYAGMLAAANSEDNKSLSIYSAPNIGNELEKPHSEASSWQHIALKKWTIFSFTRSVLKFRKIVDVAHFHFPPTEPSFAFYFAVNFETRCSGLSNLV